MSSNVFSSAGIMLYLKQSRVPTLIIWFPGNYSFCKWLESLWCLVAQNSFLTSLALPAQIRQIKIFNQHQVLRWLLEGCPCFEQLRNCEYRIAESNPIATPAMAARGTAKGTAGANSAFCSSRFLWHSNVPVETWHLGDYLALTWS